MTKVLPRDITSYDLLKMAAVILMIIDHIGSYFFPDNDWWRVAGRMCVPMWFFLIGYARSRDLGPALWVGAAVLVAANIVTGMYVFPLNILATMIVVRLLIDPVMRFGFDSPSRLYGMAAILVFLILPTSVLFEYGTLGVLAAILGYFVRHGDKMKNYREQLALYLVFLWAVFVFFQLVSFGFGQAELMVLAAGIFAVMAGLCFFRPAVYPRLTAALPEPVAALIRLFGRRTLEIYVLHLVLFKFAALLMGYERFGWFGVSWLNMG